MFIPLETYEMTKRKWSFRVSELGKSYMMSVCSSNNVIYDVIMYILIAADVQHFTIHFSWMHVHMME